MHIITPVQFFNVPLRCVFGLSKGAKVSSIIHTSIVVLFVTLCFHKRVSAANIKAAKKSKITLPAGRDNKAHDDPYRNHTPKYSVVNSSSAKALILLGTLTTLSK